MDVPFMRRTCWNWRQIVPVQPVAVSMFSAEARVFWRGFAFGRLSLQRRFGQFSPTIASRDRA